MSSSDEIYYPQLEDDLESSDEQDINAPTIERPVRSQTTDGRQTGTSTTDGRQTGTPTTDGRQTGTPTTDEQPSISSSGGSIVVPPQTNLKYMSIPELNLNFKKVAGKDKNHPNSYCLACKEVVYSTDSRLLQKHLRFCSVDQETKETIATALTQSTKENFLKDMTKNENKQYNLLLTNVIISNNISLRSVGCKYLLELVNKMKPNWKVACRREITQKYIPILASICDKKFETTLEGYEQDFLISVEFDHWRDSVNRSVLAVVATLPGGQRHLVSLEDVTLRGHSTNSILKSLKKSLGKMTARKINAVMSDSASSCKKARQRIVEQEAEYTHLLEYRCQAHLFNLIGAKVMEDEEMDDVFSGANKLVSFISSNSQLQSMLTELGYKKLIKSCSVRWYSHIAMLESLLEIKSVALELFEQASRPDCLNMRLLRCETFWADIPKVVHVLKPLSDCIATAERANGTLGESTKALFEYIKFVFNSDWDDAFNLSAAKSVLHYISVEYLGSEEFGLMIAAYILDKRFNMNYVKIEGLDLAFNVILNVAAKSGFTWTTIEKNLVEEFKKYKDQEGTYSAPADEKTTAAEWWKSQPNIGILKTVAMRLAMLKSSSANTERTFSMIKLIQSPTRTRFALDTLELMAKIKISMQDQEEFDCLDFLTRETAFIDDDIADEAIIKTGTKYKEYTKSVFDRIKKLISTPRADPSPNSNRAECLGDARLRESYEKINDTLDFNLLREPRARQTNAEDISNVDKSMILKKFRAALE